MLTVYDGNPITDFIDNPLARAALPGVEQARWAIDNFGLRNLPIFRPFQIEIDAGEGLAQAAQQWYAQQFVSPCTPDWQRPLYLLGGALASLWTPGNSDQTFGVLSTALGAARPAAATTLRDVQAAAQAARNNLSEAAQSAMESLSRNSFGRRDGLSDWHTAEDLSFVNATGRNTTTYGVNHLRTGRLIRRMNRSDIGRFVVDRMNAGDIDLTLSIRDDVPAGLMGTSRGNFGTAYVRNTQGYDETALTLIHEGIHALGVGGSRRAEAFARLAEVRHLGGEINRSTMRRVLEDMRASGAYDSLPWRINAQSPYFPDFVF